MNYLSIENITKHYGERLILNNIGFGLERGQKMALVARNGTGKSTLLRIIAGDDQAETGNVVFRNGINVGFLNQDENFPEDQVVEKVLFSGNHPAIIAMKAYQDALDAADDNQVQEAFDRMEETNAWEYETKAKQIAFHLKLGDLMSQKIKTLSGGQKKRLALAKVLADDPDILMLDEPTNHLDMDMIEWLEQYLSQPHLTVLMVTHDRYFLDRVCNQIIELEDGEISAYSGNYSYFTEKKAERMASLASSTLKAKNLYKRELEWIRRQPKARSTKAKYRVDAFDDVKAKASKKIVDEKVQLDVKTTRMGTKTIELHNVSKSFGDQTFIKGFNYLFKRKEKVGVIGKNGTGKSTFLNLVSGELKPDTGKVIQGETVELGYYKQQNIQLRDDQRVIEAVKDIAEVIPLAGGKKLTASQMCERFLFDGQKQYQYISTLSGGEKKRLYLLIVLMRNPNFLILDEPTNDLDIPTLVILEDFLAEFDGCVLIVSHDRFFLDKVVDHLFAFEGKAELKDFPGNYTQYRDWSKERDKQEVKQQKQVVPEVKEEIKEKPVKKEQSTSRKLTFKEKFEFEQIEGQIEELETEKEQLTNKLTEVANEHEEMMKVSSRLTEVVEQLDAKTERWVELSELAG